MRSLIAFFVRLSSFFRKEIIEVLRQPKLVLTLILGPFLILFLFGLGYTNQQDPVTTMIVAEENNELAKQMIEKMDSVKELVNYVGRTSDEADMRTKLEAGEIDLGIVVPSNALETVRSDEQAELGFYQNQLDPNQESYLIYIAQLLTQTLNQQTLITLAQESDIEKMTGVSAEVLTEPFNYRFFSVTGVDIKPTDFLTPGVIVLLLQHMMTTLAALSIVREQRAGTLELYRVSPLRSGEILVSKYITYIFFGLLIATALSAAVYFGLGFPMNGDWLHVLYVILAVLFTSVGLGFVISLVSKTDTEAVQFAMIALLFSVFFSGFFIDLRYLKEPIRFISYAIPASYGRNLLQDIMLRGSGLDVNVLLSLIGIGGGLFIISLLLLSHHMRRD